MSPDNLGGLGPIALVEVKDRKRPYDGFRPADREAMLATPLPPGGVRWLANVRGSGAKRTIKWVHEHDWPA